MKKCWQLLNRCHCEECVSTTRQSIKTKVENILLPFAGFTLAEVLITLTIIGVIAAITIPNLAKKWQDQHTVSAVKEAYSIFNNATKLAIAEYGIVSDWGFLSSDSSGTSGRKFAERIMPYLKIKKYCGTTNHSAGSACFSKNPVGLNGAVVSGIEPTVTSIYGGQMMLENGMTAAFKIRFPQGATKAFTAGIYKPCEGFMGTILVDINGKKGPDKFGIDTFKLPISENGIGVNSGCSKLSVGAENFDEVGRRTCRNKNSNGKSCANWILIHNNVDYKYRDVYNEW